MNSLMILINLPFFHDLKKKKIELEKVSLGIRSEVIIVQLEMNTTAFKNYIETLVI